MATSKRSTTSMTGQTQTQRQATNLMGAAKSPRTLMAGQVNQLQLMMASAGAQQKRRRSQTSGAVLLTRTGTCWTSKGSCCLMRPGRQCMPMMRRRLTVKQVSPEQIKCSSSCACWCCLEAFPGAQSIVFLIPEVSC